MKTARILLAALALVASTVAVVQPASAGEGRPLVCMLKPVCR